MKHLVIRNPVYRKYLVSFNHWLTTLGYSEQSCKSMPSMLREFFHYLEAQSINEFTGITSEHITNFINYLKIRKNYRGEGGLSLSHINGHIGAILRFTSYLKSSTGITLAQAPDYLHGAAVIERVIFSPAQIKSLYEATDETPFGMRDRVLLTVYYGCALRHSEGAALSVDDVLFERKLLHVRKAKNGHERYVPITTAGLKCLETYITQARPLFLSDNSNEKALFINARGEPLSKHTLYKNFIELTQKAGITQKTGIHTLRHSIATHLMQNKMELDQIALFLGHRCLDSTQIYTHLAK